MKINVPATGSPSVSNPTLTLEDISSKTNVPSDKVLSISETIVKEIKYINSKMKKHIDPLVHQVYADEPQGNNLIFLVAYERSKMPAYQSTLEVAARDLQFITNNHELNGLDDNSVVIKIVDVADSTNRTKYARLLYVAPKP